MFKSASEIKECFIADGWSKSTDFEELTIADLKKIGVDSMLKNAEQGHKYFRMLFCGNIYNDSGNVVLYDIPVINS